MKNDPGIEAVRQARRDISRELENDPVRLVAHYMDKQKDFKGRLVHGPEWGDDNDEGDAQADLAMAEHPRMRSGAPRLPR
jgi:hypothetical protein